ncbi:MAG: hypothetical protein K1X94_19835 [Sandaracinaceae bacterium]|nr:hypothetical protein [Sandaracinaceae bacterium]
MRAALLALGLAWASQLVLPRDAHALEAIEVEGVASETASLGWSRLPGTESCATAIELGEAVEAILGRDVLVAAPDAALSLTAEGYRATIAVTRRGGESEGERVYEHAGHECSAATEAIALILALLIDPDASLSDAGSAEPESGTGTGTGTGTGAGSGSDPTAGTGAESESGTGEESGTADEPQEPAPFGLALDLSGMLAAFVTPSAAPAGRAAIHLRFPSGPLPPLTVVALGWLSPWSRAQGAGDAWADYLFAIGGVGLCVAPRLASWLDLSICAAGEAGGSFVIAQQALTPDERERVAFFFEASATLRAHVYDAFTAHLGISLAVPFRTEPWAASGAAYWRPDPVGLFVFLGVGFDVGFGR